ncbi:polysaccharide biosynthesis/export family protein [Mesorhizobium sp. M3A.F.Ca.ET.201.01.1.1]|uniref:polysaccharide biosynthesis/export family protein n=1 Tax=Mesorhizobium sp. M3A.F.Ca.ET.201.01.1.1 TaxID=2563946 RepID=UPI001674A376|nr:polysaccharide biosynthesis/export family protein [Mesorhizobium sp. M3A.F.Ca.ET.201.01.1.1]
MLCLISLWLVLLLGSAASSQAAADDKLAPGDRIELRVWRWTTLRDGAVEGLQVNQNFSIDATGGLELPNIGRLEAAGLQTDELAKLIADCLQARSGQAERPETTVKRIAQPAMETTASLAAAGDKPAPEPPAVAAATANSPAPQGGNIEKEPGTAPAGAPEPQLSAELAFKAAQALRQGAQALLGGHEETGLRRELAAARAAVDLMQRNTRDLSAQARAGTDAAARQGQALEEQRRTAEALARDLEAARRTIEGFKAKAIVWDNEKAAMLGAQHATQASQAAVEQALAVERQRVGRLEQELATSRQTIVALQTGADRAAAEQAGAVRDRQAAEAELKQAGEALELARQRADAAAHDLDAVRKERDAARQAAEGLGAALQEERERANGLARSLGAARQPNDVAKARGRAVGLTRAPKARNPAHRLAAVSERPVPARKQLRKPQADLVATITLPPALLPTRPPRFDLAGDEW